MRVPAKQADGIVPGHFPLYHYRGHCVKVLSYVHLRNIYRSTGVGRVARALTENLARSTDIELQVLADPEDHRKVVDKVGEPWTSFRYHFFRHDTSRQQALWYLTNGPCAESYWPETDLVYCTAESYVPVRKARLVISCHDAQHFEPGVHKTSLWLLKQRFKWKLLFGRLAQKADLFHMISKYSAGAFLSEHPHPPAGGAECGFGQLLPCSDGARSPSTG